LPEALTARLADARPAVRDRAIAALGRRGAGAVPALLDVVAESGSPTARRAAVWAASRIDDEAARPVAHRALEDENATVRQAALHAIAVRRDGGALESVHALLQYGTPANRRAAAEALGRIGDPSSGLELVRAARDVSDRAFHHSITYALLELGDIDALRFGLQSPHDAVQRAALVALEQLEPESLAPSDALARLDANDEQLRAAAAWVAGRHSEWGEALADFVRNRLSRMEALDAAERSTALEPIIGLARTPAIQAVLAATIAEDRGAAASKTAALEVIKRSRIDHVNDRLVEALVDALRAREPRVLEAAFGAIPALELEEAQAKTARAALLALAESEEVAADHRLAALAALPGGLETVAEPLFRFLLERLESDRPALDQLRAADLLASAEWSEGRITRLVDRLEEAGPLALPRLLPIFETHLSNDIGIQVIEALQRSPARTALRPGELRERFKRFGAPVQARLSALIAEVDASSAERAARIERLLPKVAEGDMRRGQAVFNGDKGACRSCHAIGYVGGAVGPDLTRIGRVRTERDLLEALLHPSSSFVQSYEPLLIATTDGRVFNGVPRERTAEEIVLAVDAERTVRLATEEIETIAPGEVSIMPAGLDQQLSEREIADLVAFLKSCQ